MQIDNWCTLSILPVIINRIVPVTMNAVRWHYWPVATVAEAGMGEYAEQIQFERCNKKEFHK